MILQLLSLLFGGGVGAGIMQLYTAKINKQKLAVEVQDALTEIERKKQDNMQDAFDTVYQELNKCLTDYTAISQEYREHREKMRKYEESVQEQIHAKCVELAELKSKITYLKGIRCYDTLCPHRISVNPDKKGDADIENTRYVMKKENEEDYNADREDSQSGKE